VEVASPGWDTHDDNFQRTAELSAAIDQPMAELITDLRQRGMLDRTLVVWMGEFGRTPKLKKDGGRDHYAKGWITALSGAGVKTGQVIGATDKDGKDVTDRPVGVQDLFVTFCHFLGLDPRHEYMTPEDQPIQMVKGGELISELV
jgi:arylsulfatase A-like enzyme